MTVRQRESVPDLLKGTALVLMVQVHIMELFAQPSILGGWLGKTSLLLGGPPVAPVFVGLMGYFAGRQSPSISTALLVRRAVSLLGLGLLLNLGLNAHLYWRIHRGLSSYDPWPFVFGVDILFLAGLSLLVIALVRPLFGRHPGPWLLAAIGVILLTPLANDAVAWLNASANETPGGRSWLPWLLAYVAGTSWWSYFPLFPWLAYPLLGVAVRLWRERELESGAGRVFFDDKPWRANFVALVLPSVVLALTGRWAISVTHNLPAYYHHDAKFFLWVILFFVLWARLHLLADQFLGHTIIARWLKWTGRHVTTIYVFQWLLIGNIATAVYKTQNLTSCVFWFVAALATANVLAAMTDFVWSRFKTKPPTKHG